MKRKAYIWQMLAVMLLLVSCGNEKIDSLVVGHWGLEQYVSCRTDSIDVDVWDTLNVEIGEGKGYEVFFYDNGSAKLLLNESPAFIKEFTCTYDFNVEEQTLSIKGSSWLYAFYGTHHLEENEALFNVDILNDTIMKAWWINNVSEEKPFYESFLLKAL